MESHSAVRTGAVGTLVATWWVVNAPVTAVTVILLAAWINPLIVFVIAAVALSFINLGCCRWVDSHWDGWMAGNGKRLDQKLTKWRSNRVMKHPVSWIDRGAYAWFGLAAALTDAISVVAAARIISGKPVGERRILIAAVSYAIFCAALFSLIGLAVGDTIRAL